MLNDLRDGFRNLLATPGQSAIAIFALALAIGANTAIFSVTQAVLLRPLPFTNPGRIAVLWETHPLLGKQEVAWPDYQDWRSQTRSFSEMAAFTMNGHVKLALTGGSQQPEQVKATLATHTLFPMLGPTDARRCTAGPSSRKHVTCATVSTACGFNKRK